MWDGSSWDSIDGTGWSSTRDQFSCNDDYWCDEYDGTSYLRFRIINSNHATLENATAYFDPATGEISGVLCAINVDCDGDGVMDSDEADGTGIGTDGSDVLCALFVDCDGDTWYDSEDAFPADASEWSDMAMETTMMTEISMAMALLTHTMHALLMPQKILIQMVMEFVITQMMMTIMMEFLMMKT
jgi:hypothetical protein